MRSKIAGVFLILILGLSCGTDQDSPPDLVARNSPVQTGDMAPDFTLVDQHDQKITLSSSRGKTPVVLVFYRGFW